jgi:hypothetical protein
MSSRQLRKLQQQKDLEEANRILQAEAEEEEEAEESDDEPISTAPIKIKPAFSFAALNEHEEEEGGEGGGKVEEADIEEEEEEEVEEKADANALSEPGGAPAPKPSKSKKKKKKKKKAKGKSMEKQESESDDIEAAIRELGLKTPAGNPVATAKATDDQQWDRICALLAVHTQHLKVGNEMRTLFGRAATGNHDDAGGPVRAGRQRAHNQPMDLETALKGRPGKCLPELTLRRNTLIQGKNDWPLGTTGGLSMEMLDDMRQTDGTVEFRFVHDKSYQGLQQAFNAFVEMGDPQNLIGFLTKNPYHISTLIQVSKIAKDQGDHALSSDLLERALFTFGRAGLSLFNSKLAEGKARLDFHRPENRELWLAGYQYIKSLVMKGTYRTAFEWAKLLLSLDPEEDPYCMRLMIHYLALKGHQFSWLLEIGDMGVERGEIPIYNKENYAKYHNTPSLAFAALQLRDQVKARDLLAVAMQRLPWLFASLFQELNMTAPPSIWGIQPRTDAENLFTSLYIQQTKDLWDTPESTALLMEIAHTIPKVDATAIPKVDNDEVTLDVVRFIYLDNTPGLMALVPSRMLHKANNSDADPIPPDQNTYSYEAQRPVLEGHSDGGARFNDDFNPLAALRRLIPNLGGRGADDDEFEDGEPDEEDMNYIAALHNAIESETPVLPGEPLPQGFARRIMQMIWNSSMRAGEEEEGDDEEDEDEDEGTDTDDEMPELVGESNEESGELEGNNEDEMSSLVEVNLRYGDEMAVPRESGNGPSSDGDRSERS